MRKKIVGTVLVASLAGAGFGTALTTPMSAFAADTDAAESTARSPGQWITDSLKGLVDKGTITQDQSNAVASALEDARPPMGGGEGRGMHRGGPPPTLEKAAEVLGVSEADLRTAMSTKSLADIAKEKNVDIQKVIDALVTEQNSRIDQEVTDGRLTQAQADEKKSKVSERVTNMVNSVRPERSERPQFDGPRSGTEAAPAS